MLYPGVMAGFSEQRGKDIIILPSSVHEVLLLENLEELNIRELKNLVKMVNMENVPREDILSFNVYKYSVDDRKIQIIG